MTAPSSSSPDVEHPVGDASHTPSRDADRHAASGSATTPAPGADALGAPNRRLERKPGMVYVAGRVASRLFLRAVHRPIVSGADHIPATGPVLLVSNHLSTLDTILIPSFSSRMVRFLAKSQAFERPMLGWFLRRIGAIAVERSVSNAAQEALERGKQVLESGEVFALFPEGSRSKTGLLNRGRTGAAWLALETGATVVPVGIIGTDRRPDALGTRPRVELRFGEPLDLSGYEIMAPGRARREVTDLMMQAIQRLSGQQTSGVFAEGSRTE